MVGKGRLDQAPVLNGLVLWMKNGVKVGVTYKKAVSKSPGSMTNLHVPGRTVYIGEMTLSSLLQNGSHTQCA